MTGALFTERQQTLTEYVLNMDDRILVIFSRPQYFKVFNSVLMTSDQRGSAVVKEYEIIILKIH